jgi:hypothetical protein
MSKSWLVQKTLSETHFLERIGNPESQVLTLRYLVANFTLVENPGFSTNPARQVRDQGEDASRNRCKRWFHPSGQSRLLVGAVSAGLTQPEKLIDRGSLRYRQTREVVQTCCIAREQFQIKIRTLLRWPDQTRVDRILTVRTQVIASINDPILIHVFETNKQARSRLELEPQLAVFQCLRRVSGSWIRCCVFRVLKMWDLRLEIRLLRSF